MRPQNALFGSSPKRLGLMVQLHCPCCRKPCSIEALLVYLAIVAPPKARTAYESAFHYNAETDSYTCPVGQSLIYSTTTRRRLSHYKSNPTYCQTLPTTLPMYPNQKPNASSLGISTKMLWITPMQ